MNPCDVHRGNILRYLNHELIGHELEAFHTHLNSCTTCSSALEQERALSIVFSRSRPLYSTPKELRAGISALDVDHSQPLYERILWILRRLFGRLAPRTLGWRVLVPLALTIILCLVFTPSVGRQVSAASYVDTAVKTHRTILNGELLPGIRSDSPEMVAAWFGGKVPFHLQLPASQSVSYGKPIYRLTWASLVSYKGKPAALLVYQTHKEKISLLVASSACAVVAGGEEVRSGNLTFHYRNESGFKVITWANHGLSYALVSSISASAKESCLVCHQNMADRDVFQEQP